jgi:hypothetical protein
MLPNKVYTENGVWLFPFEVPKSTEDFGGSKGTFTVKVNDHDTMGDWLSGRRGYGEIRHR